MQYSALVLALAGVALAQIPGLPQCAQTPVANALKGESSILGLCTDTAAQQTLEAELKAACSCEDINTALGLAKSFCPTFNAPALDCSASTTTPAAASTTPAAASTTPAAASTTPAAASTTSAAGTTSSSASSKATTSASGSGVVTTTYSHTTVVTSCSGSPTAASNGTLSTSKPTPTSVTTGAGSVVRVGGVAVLGAVLVALL